MKPRSRARARGTSGLNDLLLLFGIVALVASAALAGGVYLYEQYLNQQSAQEASQLQRAEAAFEPSLIEQITRLDDRMQAAEAILSNHTAPVAIFQALDQSTLQTISFSSFDLEVTDPQHISIKMQGVGQSVNSIALQAQIFSKSGVISDPIFSNISQQADGVHFDFTGDINPAAITYSSFLSASSASSAGASQAPAASPAAQPAAAPTPFTTQPAQGASSAPASQP